LEITYFTNAPCGIWGCFATGINDWCSREIVDPKGESHIDLSAVFVEEEGRVLFRDSLRDRSYIVLNSGQWSELLREGFAREEFWEEDTRGKPLPKNGFKVRKRRRRGKR